MVTQEELPDDTANDLTASVGRAAPASGCVLLVEDDRSVRRYLEVVLRQAGYEVLAVSDGLEAMRVVLTTPVQAVVTDAIMPNLSGHELVRFLRTTPSLARVPIILLSALEDRESRDTEHRADLYVSKPVSPEDLLESLEKMCLSRGQH